jgi:LmbE family N-acetylglucosaminyl deacetylase
MLELQLPSPTVKRPLRVLCVGAHCDDIDIGCGGTLLKLLSDGRKWDVTWVVCSAPGERARELRDSAKRFLRRAADWRVITHEFRDSFFPAQYAAIKESFIGLKQQPDPDLIFTHHRADLHQDHRVVSELTWNAFRRHLILEYEIPKYDGGLAPTNVYVRLDKRQVEAKIKTLMGCYRSQLAKPWFTPDTFKGIMRLRGIESGGDGGWAEGFHAHKLCIA